MAAKEEGQRQSARTQRRWPSDLLECFSLASVVELNQVLGRVRPVNVTPDTQQQSWPAIAFRRRQRCWHRRGFAASTPKYFEMK